MTPERVRDEMTAADLCEWAVYLNSPFSAKGRETLMNGWLVHTVRSIMADKRHRPKFSDSLFPFDKLYKEFFTPPKKLAIPAQKTGEAKPARGPRTVGEVEHMAHVWRKRYEKALADFKAGRTMNRFGLKVNEVIRK